MEWIIILILCTICILFPFIIFFKRRNNNRRNRNQELSEDVPKLDKQFDGYKKEDDK